MSDHNLQREALLFGGMSSEHEVSCVSVGNFVRNIDRSNAITGVDYENWHFRYVGVENAQYMAKHQLVLEEYIQKLKEAGL